MHRFWAFLGACFPRTEEPALAHCAAVVKEAREKAPFFGGKGAAQDALRRADAPLEGMRFWVFVCDGAAACAARRPFPLREVSGLEERPPPCGLFYRFGSSRARTRRPALSDRLPTQEKLEEPFQPRCIPPTAKTYMQTLHEAMNITVWQQHFRKAAQFSATKVSPTPPGAAQPSRPLLYIREAWFNNNSRRRPTQTAPTLLQGIQLRTLAKNRP